MRPWRAILGTGLIALAASASLSRAGEAPGPAEREAIIFARQQAMSDLSDDSRKLGDIVAGLVPPAELAATTRSIANGARDAVASFHPQVPGGRAKPEVWTNNADFMQRMESFARNAEAMAVAGETGSVAAVTERMIDAMPCKQCHDLYRE